MASAEDLEKEAEQLEKEADDLEQQGRPIAAQFRLQNAKSLRDQAILLRQYAGAGPK